MPTLGMFKAKKTGITAEIRTVRFNDQPLYMCKINGKVYKMTEGEFKAKWVPVRAEIKQEVLEL